ncbi:8927_t:CDS:2, partial [Funneliformis caledonium]
KVIATVALTSQSNTENSHQAISDKQISTDLTNIVDQDRLPKKKQKQTHCETKLEEKEILELLVTCSEYSTSDQINQVREALGNEWNKNQINQYISCHSSRRAMKDQSGITNQFVLVEYRFHHIEKHVLTV